MNQRTRYFLIGSGLVVAIGLGTGIVASYSGQLPGFGQRQSEFSYLPADATAVAYADVQDIMSSEFRQRLRDVIPTGAAKDAFLKETGIDLERDIDTVVAGITGTDTANVGPLVLLRGRFDAVKLEALAVQHGGEVREHHGKRILVAPSFDQEHGVATPSATPESAQFSMAFLESDLMAIGRLDAIQKAIDSIGQTSGGPDSKLMDLVSDIRGTGNAWVVGRFDRLAASPVIPENVRTHLPGIEWVAISADVSDGVRGFVRAETIDEEAGEQLRTVVNGALAAARLFAGQDPKVETALKMVQATGSGKTAQVSFAVGPELLDLMKGVTAPAR